MSLEELKARNQGNLAQEQDSTFLEEVQTIRELMTELRAEQVTVTGDYKETSRKLLEMSRRLEEASSTYRQSLDSQREALEDLKKTFLKFEDGQRQKNEEARKLVKVDMNTQLDSVNKLITGMEKRTTDMCKEVPKLQGLLAEKFMELNRVCRPTATQWLNAAAKLAIIGIVAEKIVQAVLKYVIKV